MRETLFSQDGVTIRRVNAGSTAQDEFHVLWNGSLVAVELTRRGAIQAAITRLQRANDGEPVAEYAVCRKVHSGLAQVEIVYSTLDRADAERHREGADEWIEVIES